MMLDQGPILFLTVTTDTADSNGLPGGNYYFISSITLPIMGCSTEEFAQVVIFQAMS